MELYLKLIDVLFPVFFIIGIGYYIGKKDSKFNTKFITNFAGTIGTVSYTHLRAHETREDRVWRVVL